MAEGGHDRLPTEDREGEDKGGRPPFYALPQDVPGLMDKYKDKVSGKTYERWKSQEESQESQGKTWTWEDNKGYERGPPREEVEMKDRNASTRTSTSNKVETTSFGGEETMEMRVKERERVEEEVLKVFPDTNKKYLPRIKFDEYDRLVYKDHKTWKDGIDRNQTHIIAENERPSREYSSSKFPKGLKKALGKSNVEINNENLESQRRKEEEQAKKEEELVKLRSSVGAIQEDMEDARSRLEGYAKDLEEGEKILQGYPTIQEAEAVRKDLPRIKEGIKVERAILKKGEQDLKRLNQDITSQEASVRDAEGQVEAARERVDQRLLSLRDRVKEIFKKHGFTVIAVATAIATVIGVIVSNLKAGLTKVAKGVGNGLKELGAKLGQILPGMVGAIASFIFKTAGEVIGFLAKNAWLLIVGLVVLAVEQFKKRSR